MLCALKVLKTAVHAYVSGVILGPLDPGLERQRCRGTSRNCLITDIWCPETMNQIKLGSDSRDYTLNTANRWGEKTDAVQVAAQHIVRISTCSLMIF